MFEVKCGTALTAAHPILSFIYVLSAMNHDGALISFRVTDGEAVHLESLSVLTEIIVT